ncbi:glycosyltransferase family 4 protein [Pontibacter vulgaris]|uniref:glycosyltransferase family 4 protein n=1 Tax=Pontibacter vulgaris TaxID=2905679 RepID=UPI001FA721F4|nr:glycosyltransferase family 4 protein [Pontibacter vulgaris]
MLPKPKLVRVTTVPLSLHKLLGKQLKFMNSHYEVIGVASQGELLRRVSDEQSIRVVGINMTRIVSPISDLVSLAKLYLLFKKEKPQIVHTHTPKAGLIGMLAAWLARVPVRMHTVAGLPLLEADGIKRKILVLTERLTSACACNVYSNSYKMMEIMLENDLCSPGKLGVIGNGSSNGIDTNHFAPSTIDNTAKEKLKAELKISSTDKVLCFVGRVVTDKGVNELVESFINLISKHHNLKLVIVGPFERELDALHEQTERAILHNPNICFTDYQEDVRPFLAISDIFILPSYREGFPNVVMQAGAMGVPCVVSDINGCNEIIEHGLNGLIVPAKDAKALEKALEFLIKDESTLIRMASISRQMIVSRYDQQYLWQQLLKEYRSLTKEVQVQEQKKHLYVS